ncbi:SDR family NAD(P)-dependent oxidoreductase [Maridesulfovibrio sp. FT414]|uniref:SDR family NAD(P)-dependent oxidoreductase n=1 Tax=Maridesulfovibrio sp. FT414 TaxID=2979469 RepID=UPI003D801024
MSPITNLYRGKKVFITGAAGTIGQELVKQLLNMDVAEIRAYDNNESEVFFLNERHRKTGKVNCFFGDIRDQDSLSRHCRDVDIILHTAALKHVMVSEMSPLNAVKTNVDGTANVIRAALNSETVSRVIYTSSDKAVNPTNVMGTTKLLGERLMTSATNLPTPGRKIIFSSTRFGNVIASKGSVVPIFYNQIKNQGSITLTDEQMTRFIMTIPEATRLVLEASLKALGGEVFVTKMPVMRIVDLAKAMIDLVAPRFGRAPSDIGVEIIGSKPGEKLYEELMTEEETSRALEIENMYVVKPSFSPIYETIDYTSYDGCVNKPITRAYVSSTETPMTVDEIKDYLASKQILDSLGD